MPRRFCPKCGKEGVTLIEGLCSECYYGSHNFLELPKKIEVNQCKYCNSLFLRGDWQDFNLKDLKFYISNKIKTELEKPVFEMNIMDKEVIGTVIGKNASQSFTIPYKVNPSTCDTCMKHSAQYWEVKVQLRKNKSSDLKKYSRINKDLLKRHDFLKDTKTGPDFFFISKQAIKDFLKNLQHRYKVKPAISKRFAGVKKSGGKKVKYTYCFRV